MMGSQTDLPNILIIVLDTTRYDHLSCYGYKKTTSPQIDRIASEGIIFKNAISTSCWTLPSHASLFTGLYPSKHGATNLNQFLNEEQVTIAQFLHRYGYRTIGISNNPFIGTATGVNRGFNEFYEIWLARGLKKVLSIGKKVVTKILKKQDKGGNEIIKIAMHSIKNHDYQKNPFFMFINLLEPHLEYRAPKPFYGMFLPDTISYSRTTRVNQNAAKYISKQIDMTEEDFEILSALYDAEIYYTDHLLGILFAQLEKMKVLDSTFIMIIGDHGENIGEKRLLGHEFSLAENLIHIPMIFRYPEIYSRGSSFAGIVQPVDIFLTIGQLLGKNDDPVLSAMQGQSLLPEKLDEKEKRFAFAELFHSPKLKLEGRFPEIDQPLFKNDFRAVRSDRYKYIWCSNGANELYDLIQDPFEQNNMIHHEKEIANRHQKALDNWLQSFEPFHVSSEDFKIDHDIAERLKALGYL